ncbi:hypothetical protein [Pseudoxanthomonas winnipegensis]|uniref:hypothetical protein n=1 Tax=Pseudoxanthomonas winnipegensis TaxID=2480810 RepID=UPI00102D85C6|nr:hypothetical protein [Pseudoxanthomonas winnipegensis]RZZ81396.1 hypothetical protein EA663_20440 [Pseudoxanthomonas winnipegensis]
MATDEELLHSENASRVEREDRRVQSETLPMILDAAAGIAAFAGLAGIVFTATKGYWALLAPFAVALVAAPALYALADIARSLRRICKK